MARLNNEQRELILADFHTGAFTQRKLARKYKVSTATINNITKGLAPAHEAKVNAKVTLTAQMAILSEHEVNAIDAVHLEKTRHIQFINNLTLKNLSAMAKKVNNDTTIAEHKMIAETTDKAAITLGVAERHAPKAVQAVQVNNNVEVIDPFED